MPKKTIVTKNTNTHKFGQGKIVKALGKIWKLNEGPERDSSFIFKFSFSQKCPKYIKTLTAANIPQSTTLKGIRNTPNKFFYFLGFILDILMIAPTARAIW